MSDFSAVWTWKGAEAGFMFSNISIGDAGYSDVDLKYNPLANFQFHATYLYNINESWDVSPSGYCKGRKIYKESV